jgi:putative tryptophan/tyrosine transport system substrate-binding protein
VLQRRLVHFELVEATTPAELDNVFAALRRTRVDGVAIMPVPRYTNHRRAVASAALAHRVVTVFGEAESVEAGDLMAYDPDWVEMARMAASYVGRILKGATPAELPIELPTQFNLVIECGWPHGDRMVPMNIDEIEAEVLKLDRQVRARLARTP